MRPASAFHFFSARYIRAGSFARCVRVLEGILLSGLVLGGSGCVVTHSAPRAPDQTGAKRVTQRHIVIGFGIIEIRTDPPAAIVQRGQTVGVHISQQPAAKVTVGYSTSEAVMVPATAEDVRLETTQRDGAITINVESARLSSNPAKP